MEHTPEELAIIAEARLRPIELSPAQFAYEKKIGRYKPDGYTFSSYNPGNEPEIVKKTERSQLTAEKNVRVLPPTSSGSVVQLDLFAVENTYDSRFGNKSQ